jgi:hypothetical protein
VERLRGNELIKVLYDIEDLESPVREMPDKGKKWVRGKRMPRETL